MGNICASCLESKEQKAKSSVLATTEKEDRRDENADDQYDYSSSSGPLPSMVNVPSNMTTTSNGNSQQDSPDHQTAVLRAEQARLENIVAAAGRDMVPVRSVRSTPGYDDQGFAAAFAKHLEEQMQNTATNTTLLTALPKTSSSASSDVLYATLSKAPWDAIQLGTSSSGLAGCGGENPVKYMDHVAETLVASMVPTKENLFFNGTTVTTTASTSAGAAKSASAAVGGPLVENLL